MLLLLLLLLLFIIIIIVLQIQDGGRRHVKFCINANNFGVNGLMSTKLGGIIKGSIPND